MFPDSSPKVLASIIKENKLPGSRCCSAAQLSMARGGVVQEWLCLALLLSGLG